jgi:dienelactone hydrolase
MKTMIAGLMLGLLVAPALADIQTREIDYRVGGESFTGYLAWDDAVAGERPGVLVVHEWWGHNAYARRRAEMLAESGYTALALDMYGSGKLAEHPEDAKKFMQAVAGNMDAMKKRFLAAKGILANNPTVDHSRIAAIGYCFGGGVVLNMARAGVDLDGVVSFHGSLGTETPAQPGEVKARVLVLTGADDPFVPKEQVKAFEAEMQAAGVRYDLHSYPGVKHSFTNPQADAFGEKFDMPLAYDEAADKASWARMQTFLKTVFGIADE